MGDHRVRLRNVGTAGRIFHNGAEPIKVAAGEVVEAVISDETLAALRAERQIDGEPPPLIVDELHSGAAGAEHAEREEHEEHEGAGRSQHRRRPPPSS